MKKIMRLVAVLLSLSLLLCGCERTSAGADLEEENEIGTLQIGMCFDSFVIERWLRDRDAFVMTAKELGAEVNVQTANGDVEEQISQIEYFIEKKVDCIVIIPVDGDKLADVIAKAHKAGIKIISYDRLILGGNTDLYISFDNEEVGALMGEAMVEALPDGGKIAMINGPASDNNVTMVKDGFKHAVESSNLEIVYEANCENWEADLAQEYVEEILSEYPDVVGIMCGNDDVATQVFQVLSEHRMAGKVVIVGQDAELSACQRIVEGTQTMTVYKQVVDLANAAAELAVELAKGEDITSKDLSYYTEDTIQDGVSDVPYYKLDPVAVTVDNMDAVIIQDGFHEKDDVYLNVK